MHKISVVLDDIRSALNVGAIFRTCEAAAVEKLYLTGITPYPPHNRIPKTALGAIENVAWENHKDKIAFATRLATKTQLISIELTDTAVPLWDYTFPKPCAVVFGNEITGVDKSILDLSQAVVKIPMYGKKESLNVATALGIVVYEIIRQWEKKDD